MKKSLLVGIIGFCLFVTGVNAETIELDSVSSTGQTVTVGEVDMPIYSVDIRWGDLTYNYSYNEVTKTYEWKPNMKCIALTEDNREFYENLDLYSDEECKYSMDHSLDFDDALSAKLYYSVYDMNNESLKSNEIMISDQSTNGRVKPSVYWESEEDYDFVVGKFQYEGRLDRCIKLDEQGYNIFLQHGFSIYNNNTCTTIVETGNSVYQDGYYGIEPGTGLLDMEYGEIPDIMAMGSIAGPYHYRVFLNLENDSTKEAKMPVKGDTIGTVTINLSAN